MNSRTSSESPGADAKDYLEMNTRPTMSYLEPDHRPSESYLELEDRASKAYLELEERPTNSHLDEQTKPPDSNLHDEGRIPNAQPTQREIPTSQPNSNGGIPSTNVYDIYYDDTAIITQNRAAWSNGPAAQNGLSHQPSSCSSTYPTPYPLPLNGTGRQGQALPEPPPEATVRKLSSFNTNYNTMSRRTHLRGNIAEHETAVRELAEAGLDFSSSSSRCCIRRRDVFWVIFGLLMAAACIAGCYYGTHTVVSRLCQSNVLNLGQASTIMYGEVHFNMKENITVFERQFKSDVENAMQHTVLSFFLNNITVVGFRTLDHLRNCRFTLSWRVEESKRTGLEDFVRRIFVEKFNGQRPDEAIFRCIVIATLNQAKTYSCPEPTTSQSIAVTSSAVRMTSSAVGMTSPAAASVNVTSQ